jgi:hypothetical protein
MKLGAEPMETPRFGAIVAVSRSRSTWCSIQAHCQRSYVRVETLKNESLHARYDRCVRDAYRLAASFRLGMAIQRADA